MRRVGNNRQTAASRDVVQPMPPLTDEQLEALRTDIAENGVRVPVTVDQHGRIIDGNNRAAIADDLGVDYPTVTVEVTDDDAALDLALTLNCTRRHLSREQKRELIRSEIIRRPEDSDRAIARRLGCSPSTVGAVRSEVSNLDTPNDLDPEAAARVTAEINESFKQARGAIYALVGHALTNHVTVTEVIGALTMARMRYAKRDLNEDAQRLFLEHVFDYVIEVTSWDETLEQFPPHPDSDPTADERAVLIEGIVMMGNEYHPADLVETR